MVVRGARYVARAARACANIVEGLLHGRDDGGVLSHAEIIIGTPNGDFPGRKPFMKGGFGKPAPAAARFGKNSIAAFRFNLRYCVDEKFAVIDHPKYPGSKSRRKYPSSCLICTNTNGWQQSRHWLIAAPHSAAPQL